MPTSRVKANWLPMQDPLLWCYQSSPALIAHSHIINRLPRTNQVAKHPQTDWEHLSNLYVRETSKSPELFEWLPTGPYDHESFGRRFDAAARHDRGAIILAILLKRCTMHRRSRRQDGDEGEGDDVAVEVVEVDDGTFAGTIGLLNTDLSRSRTEMGHVSHKRPFVDMDPYVNLIYSICGQISRKRYCQSHFQNRSSSSLSSRELSSARTPTACCSNTAWTHCRPAAWLCAASSGRRTR